MNHQKAAVIKKHHAKPLMMCVLQVLGLAVGYLHFKICISARLISSPSPPTCIPSIPTLILLLWRELSCQQTFYPVQTGLALVRAHPRWKRILPWTSQGPLLSQWSTLLQSLSYLLRPGGTAKNWASFTGRTVWVASGRKPIQAGLRAKRRERERDEKRFRERNLFGSSNQEVQGMITFRNSQIMGLKQCHLLFFLPSQPPLFSVSLHCQVLVSPWWPLALSNLHSSSLACLRRVPFHRCCSSSQTWPACLGYLPSLKWPLCLLVSLTSKGELSKGRKSSPHKHATESSHCEKRKVQMQDPGNAFAIETSNLKQSCVDI